MALTFGTPGAPNHSRQASGRAELLRSDGLGHPIAVHVPGMWHSVRADRTLSTYTVAAGGNAWTDAENRSVFDAIAMALQIDARTSRRWQR